LDHFVLAVGSATSKDQSKVMQSNAVLPSLGATVDHELEGDVETVEGYGELSVDQVASKIVAQVLERVVLGEESRAEL